MLILQSDISFFICKNSQTRKQYQYENVKPKRETYWYRCLEIILFRFVAYNFLKLFELIFFSVFHCIQAVRKDIMVKTAPIIVIIVWTTLLAVYDQDNVMIWAVHRDTLLMTSPRFVNVRQSLYVTDFRWLTSGGKTFCFKSFTVYLVIDFHFFFNKLILNEINK